MLQNWKISLLRIIKRHIYWGTGKSHQLSWNWWALQLLCPGLVITLLSGEEMTKGTEATTIGDPEVMRMVWESEISALRILKRNMNRQVHKSLVQNRNRNKQWMNCCKPENRHLKTADGEDAGSSAIGLLGTLCHFCHLSYRLDMSDTHSFIQMILF